MNMVNKKTMSPKEKQIRIALASIIGIVFIAMFFFSHKAPPVVEVNKKEIHCVVCGKNLTDDYNRIYANENSYYCTLCYEKTMKDIHDEMRAEGYNVNKP